MPSCDRRMSWELARSYVPMRLGSCFCLRGPPQRIRSFPSWKELSLESLGALCVLRGEKGLLAEANSHAVHMGAQRPLAILYLPYAETLCYKGVLLTDVRP